MTEQQAVIVGVNAVRSVDRREDRILAIAAEEAALDVLRRNRPRVVRFVTGDAGAAIGAEAQEERVVLAAWPRRLKGREETKSIQMNIELR